MNLIEYFLSTLCLPVCPLLTTFDWCVCSLFKQTLLLFPLMLYLSSRPHERLCIHSVAACACSERRIMCEWASRVMWEKGKGGNRNQCWWHTTQGELSAKWLFIKEVNNVKHKSTQMQHNETKPPLCMCVFRGSTVNYLPRSYPLSLRPDIQRACVFVWAVCVRVQVCAWMSRRNENGYDSDRAINEWTAFFLVTCGVRTCWGTHTRTYTHAHTILLYLRQWGAIEPRQ